MSHHTARESYRKLSERINRFPQGAPPTKLLFQILEVLFTPAEAELVALLPIKPFTAETAALLWKKSETEARNILEALASRGMMLDIDSRHGQMFAMPPPMAGFFEFSMMRIGDHYDQKLLAELFYQYLNVEEDFVKALFATGETQIGRAFVNERVLTAENTLHVLDYERASRVVETASHIGIGTCYCRHKASHLGRNCEAPMDICMTFNSTASSLIKHGIVRRVDKAECHDLLAQARDSQPGAIRGERARARVLHLQLLRMLLRSYVGRQTVRRSHSHQHHQLPSRHRRGQMFRLHEMCRRLSGGSDGHGFCGRPTPPQTQES
jgi:hypothetical protein